MKFSIGSFIPFIGWHHLCMMVNVVAITLSCVLLAGSSADRPVTRDVYLLSFSYTPTNSSEGFNLRVGYFGICAQQLHSDSDGWKCNANGRKLGIDADADPLGIIGIAQNFKDGVIFPGIIIAAVILASFATLGLFTTPGWHEETDENGSIREVKPFPRRGVTVLSFAAMLISGLLQLVGSLWQHVAATAARSLIGVFESQGVSSHIGQASMAFTWIACFLLLICAFMLRVTMDSVLVLKTAFFESDDIYVTLRSTDGPGPALREDDFED